jgi:TPR repeat protein
VADAERFLRSAALQGQTRAQLALGILLLNRGNENEGIELIRLASDGGLVAAQYEFALLQMQGHGMPADERAAIALMERAAAAGHPPALFHMAVRNLRFFRVRRVADGHRRFG